LNKFWCSGYTKIYSNDGAFAALKADGSIKVWGNSNTGGVNAPAHALIDPSALMTAKADPVE
jgi:hypothetical protein